MEYKLTLLIMVFIILTVPSMAVDNGYARIVYNVRGLQDYDLHWNDRFPPGSILKIYAEANGVNHQREVAVDYIFIIKDPNNNVVDTSLYSNRYEDYRENDFMTYSKNVPQGWVDGVYTADVHIFDLLNESLMDTYYSELINSYLNESDRPDLPVMNRSNASALPEQHLVITKTFFVDRYANKYPVDRFRIEKIMLDRTSVAPDMPVTVSVNVSNTFYDKGSTSLDLLLDNKVINKTTLEIESYSSSQTNFTVSSGIIGDHTVEIIPTGMNTIGLNMSVVFTVSAENKIETPTEFVYQDIQIDKLSVEPNQTVTIAVTVKNTGKEGTQPVELFINDVLEEGKQVNLNFSEIKDVYFNVTKGDVGAYRVTVDKSNLSKIFFVESSTPVPAATVEPKIEKKPQLRVVIGLSVIVILIYLLRLYLKNRWK
ncbi:MAG: hypothetical protein OIN84_20280 [Candidatus Methanoperedens sp.]|nr:hypothetical protein [Candidatus Methanoperedens sp. BLZ2]KAB2945009.1 MAG: hypothetical protein F9K14_12290 [Candidatus Methanoperedens sp.]MBZ0176587.1 hypothetical protein [Candidatus Methanoperedens nitroreducens]MCX9080310.1 hypothetical protein [Candidatus Methanoperedens sp.]